MISDAKKNETNSKTSNVGDRMTNNDHQIAPNEIPMSSNKYVTKLTPNDILLGRGAPIINYEGNVRFRALVSTRKAEYNSTGRHQIKDEIARQIISQIDRRSGKFLKKVESQEEAQRLGIPEGESAWTIAEEDVILEKVKQSLRDKEPERRIARSESFNVAQQKNDTTDIANALRNSQSMPLLSFSENIGWTGGRQPLPPGSFRPYIAPLSIVPHLPYVSHQSLNSTSSISPATEFQRENDHTIRRLNQGQQHQRQTQLVQYAATPQIPSSVYLQALLQQNNSLTTRYNRLFEGARNADAILPCRGDTSLFNNSEASMIPPVAQHDTQQKINNVILAQYLRNDSLLSTNIDNLPSSDVATLTSIRDLRLLLAQREHQRIVQRQYLLPDQNWSVIDVDVASGSAFLKRNDRFQNVYSDPASSLSMGQTDDGIGESMPTMISSYQGQGNVDDQETEAQPLNDGKRKSSIRADVSDLSSSKVEGIEHPRKKVAKEKKAPK
jgi:hypothetical protein